jgi:antitoxin MazE
MGSWHADLASQADDDAQNPYRIPVISEPAWMVERHRISKKTAQNWRKGHSVHDRNPTVRRSARLSCIRRRSTCYECISFAVEDAMQVARWGNSLAVRLPVELVRRLGLKKGDRIELIAEDGALKVLRHPGAEEVLNGIRHLRGRLPAAERLSRDAAHER